jgi:hypothetical protein
MLPDEQIRNTNLQRIRHSYEPNEGHEDDITIGPGRSAAKERRTRLEVPVPTYHRPSQGARSPLARPVTDAQPTPIEPHTLQTKEDMEFVNVVSGSPAPLPESLSTGEKSSSFSGTLSNFTREKTHKDTERIENTDASFQEPLRDTSDDDVNNIRTEMAFSKKNIPKGSPGESLNVYVSYTSLYAIGAKVKFTRSCNGVLLQRMSTIGGIIAVDNRLYGLTTAHGVDELLGYVRDNKSDVSASDTGSVSESEGESERTCPPSSEVLSKDSSTAITRKTNPSDNTLAEDNWRKAVLGPLCYGRGNCSEKQPGHNPRSSDFALIVLPFIHARPNTIIPPVSSIDIGVSSTTFEGLTIDKISEDLNIGEVYILCSTGAKRGYLLEGDSAFLDGDTVFSTKKIQTDTPLGRGLSGTWVVRGQALIGILIAVYEGEPYAHMMPISQVVSAIKTTVSNAGNIPKVELPRIDYAELYNFHQTNRRSKNVQRGLHANPLIVPES